MTRLSVMLKNSLKLVADNLWPPFCISCETPIRDSNGLCSSCWAQMRFLSAPQCFACGVPFPFDVGDHALCVACSGSRPAYRKARSALIYDDISRGMILAFKHGDRTDLVPAITNLMMRPGAALLEQADIVSPVPLHWSRLLSRRYNQAGLLSIRLANLAQTRSIPDLLIRTKRTGTQGGKSNAGRRRNVQGAFIVNLQNKEVLQGRRVLLIDDVLTTGATVEAASRALLKGGATAVDVLTIARVVTSGL